MIEVRVWCGSDVGGRSHWLETFYAEMYYDCHV